MRSRLAVFLGLVALVAAASGQAPPTDPATPNSPPGTATTAAPATDSTTTAATATDATTTAATATGDTTAAPATTSATTKKTRQKTVRHRRRKISKPGVITHRIRNYNGAKSSEGRRRRRSTRN